ncbi:MAG: YcaQ family DNA glycosylase [Ignavibacteria bacterium]|nr:YcaQ family DNA glycosylase [Ignavibacteria bacterium]
MKIEKISEEQARFLAANNLYTGYELKGNTKNKLLNIINVLGYVQIDTISIVERAHKHVLWTRLPEYKNTMLDELIDNDRKVFEFWDHAAAYMPMKHFRFSLPRKKMYAAKYKGWESKNKKLLKFILDRISNEGPQQSRDFEESKKRGLWWDWKPAKEGLEFLFHTGRLMARARKSFQKVYDLPERVLPADLDLSFPSDEEHSEHLIMRSITANGISAEKELTYLRHHDRSSTKKVLKRLLDEKKIVSLNISGNEKETYYSTKKILGLLNKPLHKDDVHILSPFDNIVIQRKRLQDIFGFDYLIECYVPAAKRKFGYFCLPVLYGNTFAGRIDAKADRNSGKFIIINEFWEKNFKPDEIFKQNYINKLNNLANFAGCIEITGKTSFK